MSATAVASALPGLTASLNRTRLGGRGKPPEYYACLALAYSALVYVGYRKPVRHLATEFNASVTTVSQQIREARRRGFLTGEPGKTGGNLTPKAIELIHSA